MSKIPVLVELEEMICHQIQLKKASTESVSSGDTVVYSCVLISTAVEVDAVSPDDIAQWIHVNIKEIWTQN